MQDIIRLGARGSKLSLIQANIVKKKIEKLGYKVDIVVINSDGDINRCSAIYKIGITGVFTKTLDDALLNGKIDLAVHSLKDVPTILAQGLCLSGVPARGDHRDILFFKDNFDILLDKNNYTFATSSLRRKAGLLLNFPNSTIENLRGNIDSRLNKLNNNKSLDGAIFSKVSFDRLGISDQNFIYLDNLVSSPSQGAIGLISLKNDNFINDICSKINNEKYFIETYIERKFLNLIQGGCSIPVGAKADVKGSDIYFKAQILSLDGLKNYVIEKEGNLENYKDIAYQAFNDMKNKDGVLDLIGSFKQNSLLGKK